MFGLLYWILNYKVYAHIGVQFWKYRPNLISQLVICDY